mmetsp:Transcript_36297/g.116937  ORF Transcript_36297/g.116937 Transcript_36297/m.116937 type:complete len:491 (-) Transcript_36297:892-2364(-)
MQRVAQVEGEGSGQPLGRRPEGDALGGDCVGREVEEELRDPVVKVRLEAAARPADALRKGGGTLGDEDVDAAAGRAAGDAHVSAELVEDGLVVLAGGAQLGHPLWPLCEEVGHLARRGVEVAHELRVGEHEALVDVVWEVVHGALWRLLLGRVARGAVVFRAVRQHDLRVALCAERARLEQRLCEEDAAAVDVETRLDVVERVHHHVEGAPEGRVEDALCLRRDAVLQRARVQLRVHPRDGLHGGERLGLAHVVVSEEELARQVRLFDNVVVGDGELAAVAARDAEHGEALEELTAERARADQKDVELAQLADEGSAKDGRLCRVPPRRVQRLGRHLARGERLGRALERVQVEALHNRVELARRGLDDLLADYAAEDGRHRRENRAGAAREQPDHSAPARVVELLHLGVGGRRVVDAARQAEQLLGRRVVRRRRQRAAVCRAVGVERAEGEVQQPGAAVADVGRRAAHDRQELLLKRDGGGRHLGLVRLR